MNLPSSHVFASYEAAGLSDASHDRHSGRKDKDYTCPQCSHQRKPQNQRLKCLNVNFTKGVWRCNHCDWAGRLRTSEDEDAHRRREQLRTEKQYAPPPPLLNPTGVSDRGLVWFEQERAISRATVAHFGIEEQPLWMPKAYRRALEELASAHAEWPQEQRERAASQQAAVPTLLFPYVRQGHLVNRKYRARDEKDFRLHKNAELIFFNLDAIAEASECLIVEGEMDALAWHEAGVPYVVSVPNGSALTRDELLAYERTGQFDQNKPLKLEYLDNCWDDLQHIQTFYLATDSDAPGLKLRHELMRRLGAERCRIIQYPKGSKDANDTLKAHGKQVLRQCKETAIVPPVDGALRVDDVWDAMLHLLEHGATQGLPIGPSELNGHFSLRLGELTIVGGVPGDGKTTFVRWLICLTALLYGWKWAIFSPENYPEEKFFLAVAQVLVGKPISHKYSHRLTAAELAHWRVFMREHFFVMDVNKVTTPESALLMAEGLAQRYGVNALLLDPWNSLMHRVPTGMNKADYLTTELTRTREFNRKYNASTFINAHPVKQYKDPQTGAYAVVGPYDLADGAAWYNRADNILAVHRRRLADDDYTTDIHVQKVKFHDEVGTPTQKDYPAILEYEPATGRYHGYTSRTAPGPFRATVPGYVDLPAPIAPLTTRSTFDDAPSTVPTEITKDIPF